MSSNVDTNILDALLKRFTAFISTEGIDETTQVCYPTQEFKPTSSTLPFYVLDWQPLQGKHISTHVIRHTGIFSVSVFSPETDYVDGCNILVDKVYNHYWPTDNNGLWLIRNDLKVRIGKGDGSNNATPYKDSPINSGGFIRRRVLIPYFCDTNPS